ncbi:MAG: hypothetical protein JWP65_3669 [Ramlibacter sp.]|jgi:hypothetical protein|nr:hypothetical protein [Ramlibacter sp.]
MRQCLWGHVVACVVHSLAAPCDEAYICLCIGIRLAQTVTRE